MSKRIAIRSLLQDAVAELSSVSMTAKEDCLLLLAHILAWSKEELLAAEEIELTKNQLQQLEKLLKLRRKQTPIAYILGYKPFWNEEIIVTRDVLIPRSESELLVELALEIVPNQPEKEYRILDLGTGSGAIALALTNERPEVLLVASDRSLPALRIAQRNSKAKPLTNRLCCGDWMQCFQSSSFDLILSNPPYICKTALKSDIALSYEPAMALDGGDDGLNAFHIIIRQASRRLTPSGNLLIEHAYNQAEAVQKLFADRGFYNVQSHPDLQGHLRVTAGTWRE